MKIFFIVPYPLGSAPSQRFRFEQYFSILAQQGIGYHVSSFLDMHTWKVVYHKGNLFSKILGILKGLLRRTYNLVQIPTYDYVFIHREAAPVGPPVFEWLIAKVLRKKIVYDFDDAIWIPNFSEHNSIMFYLKNYSNPKLICKWAYKVSCGNDYLCNFARQYNSNVVYNPTTIDAENLHNTTKEHRTDTKFVIGWTGSHSTLQYLAPLVPVISALEKKFEFTFMVISDRKPDFDLRSLVFVRWNTATEIQDLLKMDIGLMPLPDDKWAQGKCGFKALQYNALSIPALVSPVGVNTEIIQDYVNGFVCNSLDDWRKYLILLMNNRKLVKDLGKYARPLIEKNYSVRSNQGNFLKLFS